MDARSLESEDIAASEPIIRSDGRRTQKRRITIFVIVSLVNVALLACLGIMLLTPAHPSSGTTTSDGLGDISSPLIGKTAPDFTLTSLDNPTQKIHLSDLKGKPVIINFWDASCIPCNNEASFLQKSWLRLRGQGVVMLGINGPDTVGNAHAFLQKYGITYPNVQDSIDGTVGLSYGVTGHPDTDFINKDGVMVAKWVSPLTEQGLQSELKKMGL